MNYESRVVCFIDILGFETHIKNTLLDDGKDNHHNIKKITDGSL